MKKIHLNNKENILYIKSLLDNGATEGSIKKKYGISKLSCRNIKNDRIEFDNKYIICELCKKELNTMSSSHLKFCSSISYNEYISRFPNAKIITLDTVINKSNNGLNQGKLTEESKDKLRRINLGKKHSAETKKKLSNLSKGDKNPAKRPEVKEKLKANHISKTNPERWKEICKSNGERHKGYKKTPEQIQNWIDAFKHTSKHGSKAQIYAYNYIKKYFGIFYHTEVFINDNSPFKGHTENFFCDITIPKYKISLEWNGPLHYLPIFGEEHLKKVQNNDKTKDYLLYKRGWKVFHIKDECPDKSKVKPYVKSKCREYIPQIISYIKDIN